MRVPEAIGLGDVARYPRKGWDFPRRGMSITPTEILSDNRVLSPMGRVIMVPTDETVLVQPRLETTLVRMISI